MRVLSVMCHPDDMELDCAGTLLKYKKAGNDVVTCHVANGNMGHMIIMPDELKEIRKEESKKAAALAGFEDICADFGDLTINSANEHQLMEMIRIIRYAKPDVIFTHCPEDYCSDHVETSKLVFNASFSASCPHFHPELGTATDVTPIYFTEPDKSINFIPTEYVDITEEMEIKEAMMSCHESQLVWLREHDGIDIIENMKNRAAHWGGQCGVKYAEAYRPLLVSGRLRTYRILP